MTTKISVFSLLIILSVFQIGCGHTNNLSSYDITNKKIYFKQRTNADAINTDAFIPSPSPNPLVNVVAAVGSAVVSDKAHQKLDRALDPDSLALHLANGLRSSMSETIRFRTVNSLDDDPDLICETVLEKYELESSSNNISIRVAGKTRLTSRENGKIIWEDCDSKRVTLRDSYYSLLLPAELNTAMGAMNAVRLLELPEDELRSIFMRAADNTGRELAETIRKDYAKR
jgi:hypothetical protein